RRGRRPPQVGDAHRPGLCRAGRQPGSGSGPIRATMTERSTGPLAASAAPARVSVLCEVPAWRRAFPRPLGFLRSVAQSTLIGSGETPPSGGYELSLVLTDDAQQQELNAQWRGQDKPTNVLSFPDGTELPDGTLVLGDVVLALETCRREAREQNKCLADHAAHL